ncbi:Glycosyltransferase involved in cell wall bisynthesis [Reichenbachiella faecimaris]|uniref:Glycosyltransferase involved in cell wall bisynthesis n=1 Tax=Reichenbachiella faecimaris TaxID=692418 RepID=A0A1W2GII2_REIFA|nr:glycosyltransferase [Reichenbachiella faecimaris]SMD36473.1 Glycosyltransferase involved in cell wall bisynthesis [Reichenbachiella faecimaris]
MNDRPLVSIITPAYNAGKYIHETINSVLSQTYSAWEHIIVDDGSSDNTEAVVKKFEDDRIILISQCNSGMGAARNKAISASKGVYLTFIDADDCWLPNKLNEQVQLLENSDIGLTFSGGYYFDLIERPITIPKIDDLGHNLTSSLVLKNIISIPSVMLRTNLLRKIGGFDSDPSLGIVADYELWIRICQLNVRIVSTPELNLFKYRIHEGQSTYEDKLLNTTLSVVRMLDKLKKEKLISENQFVAGCCSHFRMLLDQELLRTKDQDLEMVFSALESYTFVKRKITIIHTLSRLNRRLAHFLSWRLLKVSSAYDS